MNRIIGKYGRIGITVQIDDKEVWDQMIDWEGDEGDGIRVFRDEDYRTFIKDLRENGFLEDLWAELENYDEITLVPNPVIFETCAVADQFCTVDVDVSKCFACGMAVCDNCSQVVEYHTYGQQRLCNTDLEEYDGNDSRIMDKLYKLAEGIWKH